MNNLKKFRQHTLEKERLSFFLLTLLLAFVVVSCNNQNTSRRALSVTISPNQMKANQKVSLRFEIKVNHYGGMIPGDKFSLVIPGSWTRPLFAFDTSEKENTSWIDKELKRMISIKSGPSDKWKMKILSIGRDGTQNRAARTLEFDLQAGHVKDGSTITLQYGSPEKPIRATFLAETDTIPFRINWGNGKWRHAADPVVTTTPGTALALRVTTPMKVKAGDTVMVHITARDYYDNATYLPKNFQLICSDKKAKILAYSHDQHVKFIRIPVILNTPGFQTFGVHAGTLGTVRSNPVKVLKSQPRLHIYWGDLHSHSHKSKDGIGNNPFLFARDYANLDFYALTDHGSNDIGKRGLTKKEWQNTKAKVRAFYKPGHFVTILGYEDSFRKGGTGHHNEYFDNDSGPLLPRDEVKTLTGLWDSLRADHLEGHVMTIPHHTGIEFNGKPGAGPWVNWRKENNPTFQPTMEICSAHGQSEHYDPQDSLSYQYIYESRRWEMWFPRFYPETPKKFRNIKERGSIDKPAYAVDAWALGQVIGIVGGSDDHSARPGMLQRGLTAALAPTLTRKAVFKAIQERHTYVTTGERIYMSFRINHGIMGDVVPANSGSKISIEIRGTDKLKWVELMKLELGQKNRVWKVYRRWNPKGALLKINLEDRDLTADTTVYYLRVKEEKPYRGKYILGWGRPVRGWSSPIWVVKNLSHSK